MKRVVLYKNGAHSNAKVHKELFKTYIFFNFMFKQQFLPLFQTCKLICYRN